MKTVKILVVEDESIVALLIKEKLENLGHSVCGICASGEAAILAIESALPDLVLMDIKLQGKLDGIETANQIRKLDIPVIYMTAHSEESTIGRAKESEPYGYLLKPVAPKELQIAVEMALYKNKIDKEKALLTKKLRDALDMVKQLSGLIPICAYCKKIRDDKGYWDDVTSYISKHSEAMFSHGICPDCVDKVEKEFDEFVKKENSEAGSHEAEWINRDR
jgi:two-component system, response regulator PdtaR